MSTKPILQEEHNHLLDKLQVLLENQIGTAASNNFREVEKFVRQADGLIKKILEIGVPRNQILKAKYEKVLKSYNKLHIIIETERENIGKQLTKIRKGKKTIGAYRG